MCRILSMAIMNSPWTWNITDIVNVPSNLGTGDNWVFYVLIALILGILIGGMIKGATKLVLGIIMIFVTFLALQYMIAVKTGNDPFR